MSKRGLSSDPGTSHPAAKSRSLCQNDHVVDDQEMVHGEDAPLQELDHELQVDIFQEIHGAPLYEPPLLSDTPPALDHDVWQSDLLNESPPVLDYDVSQSDLLTMSESFLRSDNDPQNTAATNPPRQSQSNLLASLNDCAVSSSTSKSKSSTAIGPSHIHFSPSKMSAVGTSQSVLEEEPFYGGQLEPTLCEEAEDSNQRPSTVTAASGTKDSFQPQATSQSHSSTSSTVMDSTSWIPMLEERDDYLQLPEIKEFILSASRQYRLVETCTTEEMSFTFDMQSEEDIWYDAEAEVDVYESARLDTRIDSRDLLYEGAPLTVHESLIALLTFAQTEHLSGQSLSRLLELIKIHLPKPNKFSGTLHQFFNNIETQSDPLHLYYYCDSCFEPRDSASDLCNKCNNPERGVDYFILRSIESQLKKLFSRPGFLDKLLYVKNRTKINDGHIEDIVDGSFCRERGEIVGDLAEDEMEVAFIWTSDGISPFNSGIFSLWPFSLAIIYLPPAERFKLENIIIAALWGSKEKPDPNVFLMPVYDELKRLQTDGFDFIHPVTGRSTHCKVSIKCGTCDAMARATFLNIKTHAGYFACPRCLIVGLKSDVTDNVTVFPHQDQLEERTTRIYVDLLKETVKKHKTSTEAIQKQKGIKGATILSQMVPNVLRSTAIDSMHCLYLGVVKQILTLMCSPEFKKIKVYDNMAKINKRIASVTLPHFVDRELLSLDKLLHWKASVLRTFTMYVALPVFSKIMSEEYFDHLKCFVKSSSMLNATSIPRGDLKVADLLNKKFVADFEELYGLRNMSSNIHGLRHLSKSVEDTGPLWATSCFGFESMYGKLLLLIHGTRHAGLQIFSNLNLLMGLPSYLLNLDDSPVKRFCDKLQHKYRGLKILEQIQDHVFSIGTYTNNILPEILDEFCVLSGKHTQSFDRLWKEGLLYVSENYSRGSRVSSFVKYDIEGISFYGSIVNFVKVTNCECAGTCFCPGDFFAVVKVCHCNVAFKTPSVSIGGETLPELDISHIKLCDISNVLKVINITSLVTVCFHFVVDDISYLCEPCNFMELE